ncbi:hypothetical protein [Rhodococcus sp. ACPA1]|uniref:hypothetical protein n=1 Tax=Rhodococcus sp. ACPA1 TaxID=2028572 RepID=UPI000BB12EA8|nr:hypothetical protein [Rhodococcus sp. ACPA1]PBC47336.1 hypothetical protein CJ177_44525 [Rhodococcus sp. ACPA1]
MNTFISRAAMTAAAIAALAAPGAGSASAAPYLHGDPNTPGTQLHASNNDPTDTNSYSCGAIGVGGAGAGTTSPGGSGQLNGTYFGPGPVQGGCVGSDGSVYFPTGNAE